MSLSASDERARQTGKLDPLLEKVDGEIGPPTSQEPESVNELAEVVRRKGSHPNPEQAQMFRLTARTVAQPLTTEQLTEMVARKRQMLATANGEWADDLEAQIRYLEQQLAESK